MANQKHLDVLGKGVEAWNLWLATYTGLEVDLEGAELSGAKLSGVDFHLTSLSKVRLREADLRCANLRDALLFHADLYKADLNGANLSEASLCWGYLDHANLRDADLSKVNLCDAVAREVDFKKANLSGAYLMRANFSGADFQGANLSGAYLDEADLSNANLGGACLAGASLKRANLTDTNFSDAILPDSDMGGATLVNTRFVRSTLANCNVYGTSAWNVDLADAIQTDLVITPRGQPAITVDNLEVAQFIYLLSNNTKIRKVIDTITSKAVLILGRFTDERKAVLDALREELRKRDYLPILFDFEKPRSLDTDETITLLARMARFVIADITDAKAVLQELRAIVPDLSSVPVQPIILAIQEEPGMFDFYDPRKRPSVLTVHRYADKQQLLADLGDKVIRPAELKVRELRG